MSLHEETAGSGYDAPVPELDDHRHQIPTIQRPERSRRGTFDSLYATAPLDDVCGANLSHYNSRHAEEAIVDDDGDQSPMSPRSRRLTVDTILTTGDRSVSPPNSVKAFAEARRRDRGMSVSEDRGDDVGSIRSNRTAQSNKQSFISKRQTIQDAEAMSIASNLTAKEDVCFPMQEEHGRSTFTIDYEVLDNLLHAQGKDEEENALQSQVSGRSFPNLVQQTPTDARDSAFVTTNGDFVGSSVSNEKTEKTDSASVKSGVDGKTIAPPLSDPNRFSFFSSAWESTAHASTLGGLLFSGEDVRHLFSFPHGETDGVWWLNVAHPTEDEIRALCKAFGIHPLTMEDIITQEAREKIELFPSYYFASFRSFMIVEDDGEIEYEPFNIYVVVFREGTLSFTYAQNGHASHVRKRISMLKDYVALSSDWICYALIDHIVDSFAPVIYKLEREIDTIEDEVFVARPEDMSEFLRKMGQVRKQTMSLSRLLNGKADVLRGFTKRCNPDYQVTPRLDIGMYLGDIQDHIVTMHNNLQHFEKILTRTHSNYLGHLTIESIANGTKVNNVLSKITLVGSIIVPLNLVCGLFGMNVRVPFQDHDGLEPFLTILGCLIAFTMLLVWILRRWKYI
ncbi:uncharacterized protein MKZ38_002630 [Zalerion maritima]|uniref:Uncharacterized protein n=1 Tax=Zalerion maritima TaxID=339359 RepID=A0AAD5RYM8_9PEZI|nr:uncharacterized protein MKZ38_002630 [Zalerion maritima]